jgi:hypothetical protein
MAGEPTGRLEIDSRIQNENPLILSLRLSADPMHSREFHVHTLLSADNIEKSTAR